MKIEIEINEARLSALCHAACSNLSYSKRIELENLIKEVREKVGDKQPRFINDKGEKY